MPRVTYLFFIPSKLMVFPFYGEFPYQAPVLRPSSFKDPAGWQLPMNVWLLRVVNPFLAAFIPSFLGPPISLNVTLKLQNAFRDTSL